VALGVSSRSEWRSIARLREEVGMRIMDRQVLRVWPRAAWERRGLFCRRYAYLRPTRTVRGTDRKFVAEVGYPCGWIAKSGEQREARQETTARV